MAAGVAGSPLPLCEAKGEVALLELFLALPLLSFFSTFLKYSPKRALTNSKSILGSSGAGWLTGSAGAGGGTAAGGVAALSRCAGVRTSPSSSELSEDDGERDVYPS